MQAVWRSWRRQGNRLSPRASGNDGSPVDTRIPAQDPCQPRDYRMLHLCHRNHGKCSNCGEQQETKAVTYMQRFTGKGGLGQINIPGNESVPFLWAEERKQNCHSLFYKFFLHSVFRVRHLHFQQQTTSVRAKWNPVKFRLYPALPSAKNIVNWRIQFGSLCFCVFCCCFQEMKRFLKIKKKKKSVSLNLSERNLYLSVILVVHCTGPHVLSQRQVSAHIVGTRVFL